MFDMNRLFTTPERWLTENTMEAELAVLRAAAAPAKAGKPQAVLLYGEPGTGKTVLANEIAAELADDGFRVMRISASDVHSFFIGQTEENIAAVFAAAKEAAPCVMIVDDVENFAGNLVTESTVRMKNAFEQQLACLVFGDAQVLFIGTTCNADMVSNLPWKVQCWVENPSAADRLTFLANALRMVTPEDDTLLAYLAAKTAGSTYRELDRLCDELKLELMKGLSRKDGEAPSPAQPILRRALVREVVERG